MLDFERVKKIIYDGGATLRRDGVAVRFARGYQVSKEDCYILDVSNVQDVTDAVNAVLAACLPGEFCGIWINDGKAYIDISVRIAGKDEALKMGRELNQISIYDWSTGDCIEC